MPEPSGGRTAWTMPSSAPEERPRLLWEAVLLALAGIYLALVVWGGWRAGALRGHSLTSLFPRDFRISLAGAIVLWLLAMVQAFRVRQARTLAARMFRIPVFLALLLLPILGGWISTRVRERAWRGWAASLNLETLRRDAKALVDAEPLGRHPIRYRGTPEYEALPAGLKALDPVSVQVLKDSLVDLDFGGSEDQGYDELFVSPYGLSRRVARSISQRPVAPGVLYCWRKD